MSPFSATARSSIAVTPTDTTTTFFCAAQRYRPPFLIHKVAREDDPTVTRERHGVWVVGLDEAGDGTIHDLAVADERICLVVGAEGAGLGRLTRSRCDVVARIPLYGRVPSLNVSVAAALATFEIRRARGA